MSKPRQARATAHEVLPEIMRLTTLANQLSPMKLQVLCEVAASLAGDEVANVNAPSMRAAPRVLTAAEVLREVTGQSERKGAL